MKLADTRHRFARHSAIVGLLLCGLAGVALAWSSQAQEPVERPAYLDPNLSANERAADLVSRMTVAEKISQLTNDAAAIPRLGVPAYEWWNECLHGVARAGAATVFPQAIGMAASFDARLMREVATAISDEARAKHHESLRRGERGRYQGLTFWSPNINIFRDPRWGRGQETYGEDPFLTARIGVELVKGLQGDDPRYLKVVATAKHFAVHSGPESDRHHFDAQPSERDLHETYLPAFRALVQEAKVASVMGAYNRVYGESASASSRLLQQTLRKQWGFDGYVVSDCGAIDDIDKTHKIVATPEAAAALGITKGCDLECGSVYRSLPAALAQGLLTTDDIDVALRRLMTIDKTTAGADEVVEVAVTVENVGPVAGDEVVQLYARAIDPNRPSPLKQLRGFDRLSLDPGQRRQVRFALTPADDLAHYDVARQAFTVQSGEYEIQIGASSRDIPLTGRVRVD